MRQLVIFFVFFSSYSIAQIKINNVDATRFTELMKDTATILIDLRTNDEIARKGMIKNAMHIDFLGTDSEERIKKLDKNKTYLVYCAGGGRSAECAAFMSQWGFNKVINLEKGFDDWKGKGFETVKNKNGS
jgi:phage shock protein E